MPAQLVPLFLTRTSLSARTAIGVQTKLLLEFFADYEHLYWVDPEISASDPRSRRVESLLFGRVGFLRNQVGPGETLSQLGFSWWNKNKLKQKGRKWLEYHYACKISCVYVSPIDGGDAARMREILTTLDLPFVLHLWDFFGKGAPSDDMQWLINRAKTIFSVSERLSEELEKFGRSANILRFTRRPSQYKAIAPDSGPLTIALIGNCGSYIQGMKTLGLALALVKVKKGATFKLRYVGKAKHVKIWGSSLQEQVEATGFATTDDDRDRLLAECHVGYMPGPSAPPNDDVRSLYSIPSRVMDFEALQLPIVGPVHPESAAAAYMTDMGLGIRSFAYSAEELAERLMALVNVAVWQDESQKSIAAFEVATTEWANAINLLVFAMTQPNSKK